jgi:chorismate mutase
MSPADVEQLSSLRAEIEAVDAALIEAIARRMSLAREIRTVKQRAGQPVLDPAREAEVVTKAGVRAREAGLPEDEVRALYWRVMAMARRVQTKEQF